MNDLLLQCQRFYYSPEFVPRWAHHEDEAALIHEGLLVLKFRVHERDPETGTPTSLSLLRHLAPPEWSDDSCSIFGERFGGGDDYWGDPEWKDALARVLGLLSVPEGLPFSIEDLARALRVVADRHLQKFILRRATEVQVPAGTA